MSQTYATDLIGANIRAFFAQLACDRCGAVPDISVQHSDLVPVEGGAWLVTEFRCATCREEVTAKNFLPF